MTVENICRQLESVAPLALQESYDNAGLLVGSLQMELSSVLLCIDVTEEVIDEAIAKKCNMIVAHHPLIFKGLKRLTGDDMVQRCVIKAIKSDIAIYASHTNMDNVLPGVNGKIAEKIGLQQLEILVPKQDELLKLITFVPEEHAEKLRQALFEAGAGEIGDYDSCSYNVLGQGTFRAKESARPFVGEINQLHREPETRIELILPKFIMQKVLFALLKNHPYQEPAYDFISLKNVWKQVGAGAIGELEVAQEEEAFLLKLKEDFGLSVVRHTPFLGKKIKRVALCGGSGSDFLQAAIHKKADLFISGDFKYHEFFNAEKKILIADIGHYESEQFTKEVFYEIITKKMPNFAVQFSEIKTNPINYL